MMRREQDRQLTGRVEIDDVYLGGEVQGGKAGRGSPNKIPFVAAVQTTESRQAVLMCLSQRPFTKDSIQAFAEKSLAAPAKLVSDGLECFTAVQGTGILQEPHVTRRRGQRQAPRLPGREHRAGKHQTSLAGTYHAFGFSKYAHHYLGQLQYLFNRRFNLRVILERLDRTASQSEPAHCEKSVRLIHLADQVDFWVRFGKHRCEAFWLLDDSREATDNPEPLDDAETRASDPVPGRFAPPCAPHPSSHTSCVEHAGRELGAARSLFGDMAPLR